MPRRSRGVSRCGAASCRVRKLSRASQDRVADSSAIAAEVLNAIPVVQSYTAEAREAARFDESKSKAFEVAVRRSNQQHREVIEALRARYATLARLLAQSHILSARPRAMVAGGPTAAAMVSG